MATMDTGLRWYEGGGTPPIPGLRRGRLKPSPTKGGRECTVHTWPLRQAQGERAPLPRPSGFLPSQE